MVLYLSRICVFVIYCDVVKYCVFIMMLSFVITVVAVVCCCCCAFLLLLLCVGVVAVARACCCCCLFCVHCAAVSCTLCKYNSINNSQIITDTNININSTLVINYNLTKNLSSQYSIKIITI